MLFRSDVICNTTFEELISILNITDERLLRNRHDMPVVYAKLTIGEGKKHQVRRMMKSIGCYIIYLRRIAIGNLNIDTNLKLGEYRELTKDELLTLL